MKYSVSHRTEYQYASEVSESYSEARMLPRLVPSQTCFESRLEILPVPSDCGERKDFFGNRVTWFSQEQPHSSLVVTATSLVEVRSGPTPELLAGAAWDQVRDRLALDPDPDVLDARPFALDSPLVPCTDALADYARPSFPAGRPLWEAVVDLGERVHRDFTYTPGATTASTTASQALETKAGVCQDYAHVAIGCLRSVGLAARYVSGYLETRAPENVDQLVGADASHAWLAVFAPDAGWFAIDPTNGTVVDDRHITVAWGRDFTDVTPLKGVLFSNQSGHRLDVAVSVTRLPHL